VIGSLATALAARGFNLPRTNPKKGEVIPRVQLPVLKKRIERAATTPASNYALDRAWMPADIDIYISGCDGPVYRKNYESFLATFATRVPLRKASESEFVFSNGSSIAVSVSMRSATAQYLHISEFGKICAKYPEKAREIPVSSLRDYPIDEMHDFFLRQARRFGTLRIIAHTPFGPLPTT